MNKSTSPNKKLSIAVVLLLLFIPALIFAAGDFDPKLKWRVIQTEHFNVYYHQGLENVAMETARDAERIYSELNGRLEHTPRAKIHLVAADVSDFSNGETRIFPYPQILLFPTPPHSYTSLDNYDEWINTMLTHEYSHLVSIDMTRGIPKALRFILGYSVAMNAYVPGWWREGAAVYEETANTTGGRGRSVYMDMLLRCAVLEKKFPRVDNSGDGLIQWPDGEAPYLYGGAFYGYLAGRFGDKKITEFQHVYSGQIIPFAMNHAARRVFKSDFNTLWEDWEKSLEEKYAAQYAQIKSEGIVEGEAATQSGFYTQNPIWLDSDRIIYSDYNPSNGGSVVVSDLKQHKQTKLFASQTFGALSLDKAGEKLAYSRLVPYGGKKTRRFYLYADIYVYNLKTKKTSRMTDGDRASDPAWSPDGKFMVYVSRDENGTALKLLDLDKRKSSVWIPSQEGMAIDTPRFSPDGSSIVFSARVDKIGRDLFILKSGESKPVRLTYQAASDYDPLWSPDGRYVLFTSERTGIANIFAVELATQKLYQITNVVGGAFQPALSSDGKIAYSGYSAKGFDIYVMNGNPASWRPVEPEKPIDIAAASPAAPAQKIESKPYRPWGCLAPRYLLPSFWYDGVDYLIGLSTGSTDPLGKHAWVAQGLYGSASGFLNWYAAYMYNGISPSIGISAAQTVVSYGDILLALEDLNGDGVYTLPNELVNLNDSYYERRDVGRIWAQGTFGFRQKPLTLSFGYKYENRDRWSDVPELVFDSMLPGNGYFNGVEFGAFYNTTTTYQYSISPEKGFTARVGFEWLDQALGSDYDQRIFTGDWRVFLRNPLTRHHVLALRAAGGAMDGDKLFQGTFRVGGAVGESIISSPGNKFIMLRGYDVAQFAGDQALVVSGEYRFPIAYPETGMGMFPLLFQKIHGAIFADYGGAFDRKRLYPLSINGAPLLDAGTGKQVYLKIGKEDDWNLGMGAELRVTGYVGWGIFDQPLTGRLGFATDVTGNGLGPGGYIELGTSF